MSGRADAPPGKAGAMAILVAGAAVVAGALALGVARWRHEEAERAAYVQARAEREAALAASVTRAASVTVTVLDEAGDRAGGAFVSIERGSGDGTLGAIERAITGAGGRSTFKAALDGEYVVRADTGRDRERGFAMLAISATAVSLEEAIAVTVTVRAERGSAAITGVCLDAQGRPVAGARVGVYDSEAWGAGRSSRRLTLGEEPWLRGADLTTPLVPGDQPRTDEAGRFRIQAPRGRYRLAFGGAISGAGAEGLVPRAWTDVEVDGGRRDAVEIRLEERAGGVVEGCVEGLPEGSVRAARREDPRQYGAPPWVALRDPDEWGFVVRGAFLDGEGAFRLEGVPPGRYVACVGNAGLHRDQPESYTAPVVEVRAGATATAVIRRMPFAPREFQFVGAPVDATWSPLIVSVSTGLDLRDEASLYRGAVATVKAIPGAARVFVEGGRHRGDGRQSEMRVEVLFRAQVVIEEGANDEVDIRLPEARGRLVVVATISERAHVLASGMAEGVAVSVSRDLPSGGGAVTLELPPGRYLVRLEREGYELEPPPSAWVDILAGEETSLTLGAAPK